MTVQTICSSLFALLAAARSAPLAINPVPLALWSYPAQKFVPSLPVKGTTCITVEPSVILKYEVMGGSPKSPYFSGTLAPPDGDPSKLSLQN